MIVPRAQSSGGVAAPPIDILGAIRPSVSSARQDILRYPQLAAAVAQAAPFQPARQARLQAAKPGTIEYDTALREVQRFDFIRASLALQSAAASDRQAVSDECTRLSIAIFGAPNGHIAREILREELRAAKSMLELPHVDRVQCERLIAFYAEELGDTLTKPAPERVPAVAEKSAEIAILAQKMHVYLLQNYGDVLDAATANADAGDTIAPLEIVARFAAGLAVLQKRDAAWAAWKVELGEGDALRVAVHEQKIFVGEHRPAMALAALLPLFGHEVLVHGLRSVPASARGDALAAAGLPGYVTFEEGVGCLVELAIGGNDTLEKIRSRYVDVALALGMFGEPLTRRELFEVVHARLALHAQLPGARVVSAQMIETHAWQSVNRIYRGSLGNETVGVCTKDCAYYNGFESVTSWLNQATHTAGFASACNYMFAGKFDPGNPLHVAHMYENGVSLAAEAAEPA